MVRVGRSRRALASVVGLLACFGSSFRGRPFERDQYGIYGERQGWQAGGRRQVAATERPKSWHVCTVAGRSKWTH